MNQFNKSGEKECAYAGIPSKYLGALEFRDYRTCLNCELNGEAINCSASLLVDSNQREVILEDKLNSIKREFYGR